MTNIIINDMPIFVQAYYFATIFYDIGPEYVSFSCIFFFPLLVNLFAGLTYACVVLGYHKISICPRHFQ